MTEDAPKCFSVSTQYWAINLHLDSCNLCRVTNLYCMLSDLRSVLLRGVPLSLGLQVRRVSTWRSPRAWRRQPCTSWGACLPSWARACWHWAALSEHSLLMHTLAISSWVRALALDHPLPRSFLPHCQKEPLSRPPSHLRAPRPCSLTGPPPALPPQAPSRHHWW